MTIGELKILLSKYDDNLKIVVEHPADGCNDIDGLMKVLIMERTEYAKEIFHSKYHYDRDLLTEIPQPALLLSISH